MAGHYKKHYFLYRQKAVSLLELMLCITVISILLFIGTRYFANVKYQQRLNHAATMVRNIISAANTWATRHPDYTTITLQNLIKVNLLPLNYDKNPWGGTIVVTPKVNDPYSIRIRFNAVPDKETCKLLQSQFPNYTIEC